MQEDEIAAKLRSRKVFEREIRVFGERPGKRVGIVRIFSRRGSDLASRSVFHGVRLGIPLGAWLAGVHRCERGARHAGVS